MFISINLHFKKWIAVVSVVILITILVPIIVIATNQDDKVVYLTFDDGPSNVTPRLLDILKKNQVKATFFVTGQYEEAFPNLKLISDDGHTVALHSYTHEFKSIYANSDNFWADINQLETLIQDTTGKPAAKIIRFPGGSSNTVSHRYGGSGIMKTLVEQCGQKGYVYFDWTVDTKDAMGGTLSPETIANKAVNGTQQAIKENRQIVILMHDGPQQKTAPEAVDLIIARLLAEGFRFDTLDHLSAEVHHRIP